MTPPTDLTQVAEAVIPTRSPLRLPRPDAHAVGDEHLVRRLIHLDERPVVLTLARHGETSIHMRAEATSDADAELGLARARFWSGVDDDVAGFLARFADDPLIERSVRDAPWLRPYRRPMPFEVVLSAVCEQLITDERAREIKRAITRAHGRRHGDLTDPPGAADIARLAPAELERCGLAASRAAMLRTASRAIAAGRIELIDPARREESWRRLRAIRGVGAWTTSTVALHGQGYFDALPAGDHAYRVAVAVHLGRRPGTTVTEAQVAAFMARYAGWRGLAGWHLLRVTRQRAPGGVPP